MGDVAVADAPDDQAGDDGDDPDDPAVILARDQPAERHTQGKRPQGGQPAGEVEGHVVGLVGSAGEQGKHRDGDVVGGDGVGLGDGVAHASHSRTPSRSTTGAQVRRRGSRR